MIHCTLHPKYRAVRAPRCKCEDCWAMWAQRYTKNQRNIAVLAIDHQQFDVRASLGDSEKENYDYCEWLRDQIAYALGRLLARGR